MLFVSEMIDFDIDINVLMVEFVIEMIDFYVEMIDFVIEMIDFVIEMILLPSVTLSRVPSLISTALRTSSPQSPTL